MSRTVIPHCPKCRREIKPTDDVVFDNVLKGVEHATCSWLTYEEIGDFGKFHEVILRNKQWLKSFYLYTLN